MRSLQEVKTILQQNIQKLKTEKHVILENVYTCGFLTNIELKVRDVTGYRPDISIIRFWSDDGKNFKSNMESSQSNNGTSLFDRES